MCIRDRNKSKDTEKSIKNREDILTGVVLILIGAAFAVVMFIILQMHAPTEKIQLCDDGWSKQEKDGRIYETYIPENDTCKKRSESK